MQFLLLWIQNMSIRLCKSQCPCQLSPVLLLQDNTQVICDSLE